MKFPQLGQSVLNRLHQATCPSARGLAGYGRGSRKFAWPTPRKHSSDFVFMYNAVVGADIPKYLHQRELKQFYDFFFRRFVRSGSMGTVAWSFCAPSKSTNLLQRACSLLIYVTRRIMCRLAYCREFVVFTEQCADLTVRYGIPVSYFQPHGQVILCYIFCFSFHACFSHQTKISLFSS